MLSVAALVGLWVIVDLLLGLGAGDRGLEFVVSWVVIGLGLGLLLSVLRQGRIAVVVAVVVAAAALAGRAMDLGPLSTIASASFTWVVVGALIARAGALTMR